MRKPWISFTLGLLLASAASAESLVALTGHVPKQIQGATNLGRAPADEAVQLSLVVHLDQALLDQTLNGLYGPGAPARRHYLTSSEFAQQFGLADKRQKIKDFAQANGLTVNPAEDRPESMVVKVSAGAGVVEKAFGIQLNHYRGADGRVFRAHEADPMIPASLAPHLGAVVGLSNNTGVQHPHIRRSARSAGTSTPLSISGGTGPGGSLAPADIKTIYGLNQVAFNGSGQTVALFELDGYIPSDLPAYEANFGLPNTPVTFMGVGIAQNLCGVNQDQTCNVTTLGDEIAAQDNGMFEVALDLDMVTALAPGLSQILLYEAPNSFLGLIGLYDQIAADDIAQVVSSSWGTAELNAGAANLNAEAQAFQRMAAQGQTIYASSGDSGADDNGSSLSVDDPASQPFVTGVGGTSLSGTIQNPVETVWNDLPAGGAGGGGISAFWPIPSYQQGVAGTASQQFRNVPDVSLNADPNSGYVIVAGGFSWQNFGGTSAATPLWAALTALINEQRRELGGTSFGFANPTFSQFGTGSSYHSIFNDITAGNNGFYNAGVGYDDASGWGSFKGNAMLNSTTPSPGQLLVLNSLSNVYAFPNPWDIRHDSDKRQMTFANLPDGATVKLFTVSGFLMKTLTASGGKAVWDLTNDSGQTVASGLYLYIANDTTTKVTGKVAIIK